MPRAYSHQARIDETLSVGYSAKARTDRGKWAVSFKSPDGTVYRLTTAHDIRGKNPPTAFHADARDLIRKAYRPQTLLPNDHRKGWAELIDEVERTARIRPETLRGYRSAVKALAEVLPECPGPSDLSPDRVQRFGRLWLAAPSKKGRGGGKRSPITLSYYLRSLSGLCVHLIPDYLSSNPFTGVKAPKGEKRRKAVPTEATVQTFFTWVKARYPEWTALHALLRLKAVSASRTADLCQLKTDQLKNGRLTFTADIVKTAEERSLPLPADLYATLKVVAGPVWLWEGQFFEGQKQFRPSKNKPVKAFTWKGVKWTVENLFREFAERHPDVPPLTPHALRRRAITLTVQATGSVDAAASAIGVNAQTARAHYLDTTRAFDTDATLLKTMEALDGVSGG